MSRVTLIFHGHFRQFCPDPVSVLATTAAEAIDMVTRQIPGFKPTATRGRYTIKVKGFDVADDLFRPLEVEELHIWPAVQGGGGNGGFFKIVIGVVLIAASVLMPQIGIAASVTLNSIMFSMGASLVLGGLLELLSPAPKIDLKPVGQDPEASKYLGNGQNTVKIGTRIPLILGRHRVYGHFVSFNIDAKDVNASSTASGDLPNVAAIPTLTVDTLSSAVPISGPDNKPGVAFYKLSGITEGLEVYKDDGTTRITNNVFITKSEGGSGVRLKPTDYGQYEFKVQGYETNTTILGIPPTALGGERTVTMLVEAPPTGGEGGGGY